MAEKRLYLALGEEASRGVKESSAVGFIPLYNAAIPKMEFEDRARKEFRGDDATLGDTAFDRMSERWAVTLEMPFFTEAGGAKGMACTLLKHFFGAASSAENASTGQYSHMMRPAADPFSWQNLGNRALTLNVNINEGATLRNWPFVGGRVKSISFEQNAGEHLKLSAEVVGQTRDAVSAGIQSPVFAAESLRCDYSSLKVYTGQVTREGAAPDFTGFNFPSATVIRPDKVSVKIENGLEDALRLSGSRWPDKTRVAQFKVSAELTIDWEDPASGFSSISEFNEWVSTGGTTNLFFHWDTGAQAGAGDSHGLYIDLPLVRRTGADPDYSREKDPMVTLKYDGLYDAQGALYMAGVLIKNTAASV